MVVKNRSYQLASSYRDRLNKGLFGANGILKRSIRSKNKVLDFFLGNGYWPSRLSKSKKERVLAARFENYISKENLCFDQELRDLSLATGRTTNNKRKHDVDGHKKEILEFLKTHNRAPSTSYGYSLIDGEARLRHKLDYYTLDKNDMTLLGKVYEVDKCHRSGIAAKYRAIINQSLDVEKPLIRLIPGRN